MAKNGKLMLEKTTRFILDKDIRFVRNNMKNISIDEDSYEFLLWAKTQCKKSGIEHPSFSDALRWMRNALRKYSEIEK